MYITLQLLGPQTDYMNYTESEQQEVELMAEYTALYYAPRLLQSSLSAEAPIMDVRNIQDIMIWPGRSLTRIQITGQ